MAASAAKALKTAASTSAPLWVVGPTVEFSVCPVMAKETCPNVAELSACPIVAIKAVTNLSGLFSAVLSDPPRGSSVSSALLQCQLCLFHLGDLWSCLP